jgi:hypothetical protein
MKRFAFALAFTALSTVAAIAPAATDRDAIDRTARDAYRADEFEFCTHPSKPFGARQRALCSLAAEIEDCKGFADACADEEPPKLDEWANLARILAPFARILLYLFVLGVIVALIVPIVLGVLKRNRERKLHGERESTPNVATIRRDEARPEDVSDAEAALRVADEYRRAGDLKRALAVYLAASLAALARRGAIRIARHRTNGEYVRACADGESRGALREIVREVDQVEFGGSSPTEESVERAASNASAIVRRAMTIATIAIAVWGLGCTPPRRGSDPAGNELPTHVLERNGFEVGSLSTSLSTLPIPRKGEVPPAVIVDLEKVSLEDETRAHLLRWVEAGGTLVLFGAGRDGSWPIEPKTKPVLADTTELVVRADDPDNDDEGTVVAPGARTARAEGFSWADDSLANETIAKLGNVTYASRRHVERGLILAVANDDLFTNIGVMPRRNAAALVAIVRSAATTRQLRIARAEDGVLPPSNPFSALVAAGLGKGAWHALVAAIVLFLAYGIRQARPRSAEPQERRLFAEHVTAMGAFYERARAHSHALGAYGRFVELRLHDALPRGADPVAFLASRSESDPEHVAKIYARATSATANDEPRGDELQTIEELRRLVEEALDPRRG